MRRRTTSWLLSKMRSVGSGRNTHIHAAIVIALIMLVAIVNIHSISQHRDRVLSQGRSISAAHNQHNNKLSAEDEQHLQPISTDSVSSRISMHVSQAGEVDPLARRKPTKPGAGNAEARAAQLASAASTRRKQKGGGGGKVQADEALPRSPPASPPPPPRAVVRREARLGPECGDAPIDVLPALRVEATWKPGRFMRDVKYESALVTQLPFEMLDYLHLQCRAWTGRVAASVYVALAAGSNTTVSWDPRFAGRPLLAVRQAISRFYDALDPTTMCELEVRLISETVAPTAVAAVPPVNALRNLALGIADTEMVVMVDVHELPAQQLSMDLSKPKRRAALRDQLDAGYVLVLPILAISDAGGANDAAKLELAKDLVSDGKAAAVKALREGQAVAPAGEDGQLSIAVRATDYASWVQDSPAYEITYDEGFQPVVLALRKDVPSFEERTRSATGGRVAHTLDMARHISFGVHPTTFTIALPRPEPIAAMEADSLPQAAEVFKTVLSDMVAHRYTPFSRDSCSIVYEEIYAPPSMIMHA